MRLWQACKASSPYWKRWQEGLRRPKRLPTSFCAADRRIFGKLRCEQDLPTRLSSHCTTRVFRQRTTPRIRSHGVLREISRLHLDLTPGCLGSRTVVGRDVPEKIPFFPIMSCPRANSTSIRFPKRIDDISNPLSLELPAKWCCRAAVAARKAAASDEAPCCKVGRKLHSLGRASPSTLGTKQTA